MRLPCSLIAQQEKYGAFIKVGQIGLVASNTQLEVIDIAGAKQTFDLPATGLLSFKLTVAPQAEGDGQDYFLANQANQSGATCIFEFSNALNLGLRLAPSTEPAGLALKLLGEDEQEVLREMAGHSLAQNSEFGLRKTSNTIVLEAYQPVNQ